MKYLLAILTLTTSMAATSQGVVINEIFPNGTVEIKNNSGSMVDVSNYQLCNFPDYMMMSQGTLMCGNFVMQPGEVLAVSGFNVLTPNDGELGLYTNNNFGNPSSMVDYVEWGSSGHTRATVAQAAGIWIVGDFVPGFSNGESLEYSGAGDGSASWTAQASPTICAENGGVVTCTANGGTLAGGPFEFCVDGTADFVTGVTVSGNTGPNNQWVVTDVQGTILTMPGNVANVDFDAAGVGTCLIWHLSYEDSIMGLVVGNNALTDLVGCYDFSNEIIVDRINCNTCDVAGGSVTESTETFCVDSVPDFISSIAVTGNSGANQGWVITDQAGEILGLPADPTTVDFNGAGAGTCLIWSISYDSTLTGLMMGNNALNDLAGCYELSDSFYTVIREACGCAADGGSVTDTTYQFCVDSVPDFIPFASVTGNSGPLDSWVITDQAGVILGLPADPTAVNFDDAGTGTCLIWNISYDSTLTGLMMGNNALADLAGCYDLSDDFITIVRENCDSCDVSAGQLSGGPFTFCVGDSIPDNILAGDITLTDNTGSSQWVITDDQGIILGLPADYTDVDFDGAGTGTCLVWHLSFDGALSGAEVGMDAANIIGCFDLSNAIEVNRVDAGPPCPTYLDEQVLDAVQLFPNPVTDALTIINEGNVNLSIQLLDVTGRVLNDAYLLMAGARYDIDMTNLSEGVYILNMTDGSEVGSKMVLKK